MIEKKQLKSEVDDPILAYEVSEDGTYIGMICEAHGLTRDHSPRYAATFNMVSREPWHYHYRTFDEAIEALRISTRGIYETSENGKSSRI